MDIFNRLLFDTNQELIKILKDAHEDILCDNAS